MLTEQDKNFLNESQNLAIKNREGLYNSILTVSSGALILSLSFVNYFDYRPETVKILKYSWLLITLSIISNIIMRYLNNSLFFIELFKIKFKFSHPEYNIDDFFKQYDPGKPMSYCSRILFGIFWLTFIFGLLFMLIFVWINTK
jgi:hypothetical protein